MRHREIATAEDERVDRRRPARLRALLVVAIALVPAALAAPGVAGADVGYEGTSYSGTGSPTGLKRSESVLWWNDGSWWAHMWDPASADFHIFRLDESTQRWIDSGVTVETRANTHADVLWDGMHLYVASHEFVGETEAAVAGSPSYLFRFSYDALLRTYRLDLGFPAAINNYKTETLVIDKDSTGKLWATWAQDNRIYVNRTVGDDLTWGEPFALPTAGTNVTLDDNSAVIAFGNRIGVMWSNQSSASFGIWFAVHEDGQPDTVWEASRTAIQGSGTADDHLSVKVVEADSSGRVYAGIKTSHMTAAAPLFMLLVRDSATGDWTSHPVSRVSDCPTRPLIVIDEENEVVHAYATYPGPPDFLCTSTGGAIYEKTSPLNAISFAEGAGTPVIEDSDRPSVNNVSSSKQNVNSATGIALLAVNTATRRYWHNFLPIVPREVPQPPSADFTGTPTSGTAPLSVAFTDESTGGPTSWSWNFGDGTTSSEQNPIHTFAAGTYTVSLTVANANGSNTVTKTSYISVASASYFSIAAAPTVQVIPRGAQATYGVTVTPTGGFSGTVVLGVSGLPAGATASFTPNAVTLPAATTSTLTINTTSSTKLGSNTVRITGTSGPLVRATTVTLQVKNR